jgi:hypothetical protein
VRRLGRFQITEERGQQQDGLEALPEDDEERLAGHHRRRAHARAGQLPLAVFDQPAQFDDRVPHLTDRGTAADQTPDLGELGLGVGGEPGVDDPQRDLDELEVVEVARLGLVEGLLGVAALDLVEGHVDRPADVLKLLDGLGARHAGAGGGGRRADQPPGGDRQDGEDREAPHHPGYFAT